MWKLTVCQRGGLQFPLINCRNVAEWDGEGWGVEGKDEVVRLKRNTQVVVAIQSNHACSASQGYPLSKGKDIYFY